MTSMYSTPPDNKHFFSFQMFQKWPSRTLHSPPNPPSSSIKLLVQLDLHFHNGMPIAEGKVPSSTPPRMWNGRWSPPTGRLWTNEYLYIFIIIMIYLIVIPNLTSLGRKRKKNPHFFNTILYHHIINTTHPPSYLDFHFQKLKVTVTAD